MRLFPDGDVRCPKLAKWRQLTDIAVAGGFSHGNAIRMA
jgi:hypothetical protein